MTKFVKIGIVLALIVVAGLALTLKKGKPAANMAQEMPAAPAPLAVAGASLPKLVDLGSTTCIPCKMMTPILAELEKEFAGRLEVEFIDVTQDRGAGALYGISVIPTQIFLDASGAELFRHEGFFAKADILAKWKELGVDLQAAGRTNTK